MTRHDFVEALAAVFDVASAELAPDRVLGTFGPWDSLVQLSVIALIMETFDEQPDLQRLSECQTVDELVAIVGHRLTES